VRRNSPRAWMRVVRRRQLRRLREVSALIRIVCGLEDHRADHSTDIFAVVAAPREESVQAPLARGNVHLGERSQFFARGSLDRGFLIHALVAEHRVNCGHRDIASHSALAQLLLYSPPGQTCAECPVPGELACEGCIVEVASVAQSLNHAVDTIGRLALPHQHPAKVLRSATSRGESIERAIIDPQNLAFALNLLLGAVVECCTDGKMQALDRLDGKCPDVSPVDLECESSNLARTGQNRGDSASCHAKAPENGWLGDPDRPRLQCNATTEEKPGSRSLFRREFPGPIVLGLLLPGSIVSPHNERVVRLLLLRVRHFKLGRHHISRSDTE
jgi:hypothetical protein